MLRAACLELWWLMRFVADRVLPKVERRAFLRIAGLALFVRLPFFFTSTDGYMRDAAITFHDEAVFMQLGLDVLSGHAPYLHRWDALPPLAWLASAVMMVFCGGSLTLFRLLGALYVGTTGFVLFRAMADSGRRAQGAWSAVFYIVLGSTMQASQSFTMEHLVGLPLACILYILINPRADVRQLWRLLGLFGLCGLLFLNTIVMAPVVGMLYPALYRVRSQPHGGAWRRFGGALWRGLWQVFVRSAMLISAIGAGYMVFYFLYLLMGEGQLLLRSLFEAPPLLMGIRMTNVAWFASRYVVKMAYSDQWLMVACGFVFLLKIAKLAVLRRRHVEQLFYPLCLLMLTGLWMVYLRGNNGNLFMFYFLQVLPFFALMMGMTMRFDYDEARWFVIGAVALGLYHTSGPVRLQYSGLVQYALGDNSYHEAWYNDRLYRVAKVMQTFPTRGETLVVCGEDDMLYLMTDTQNPRYFVFPFNHYNFALHGVLKHEVPALRKKVVETKPLYIVGRDNDPLTQRGFSEISDIMQQQYIQVANIDGTAVFLRRDKLRGIFQ
ncbi:MAG: hypothetical protein EBV03_08530 [Proteobacteria bacterium]|nr:hypothetical protein [Pseudomonadota bacterium]